MSMKGVRILGFCIAALVPAAATAASAAQAVASDPADLLTASNDALQYNPEYIAARAEFVAARELVPQATGKLLPQLGVKTQYDFLHESVSGDYYGVVNIDRDDDFRRWSYGAQLQQALYRPELTIGRTQAELKLQQAGYKLQAAQDALLIGVSEAYFGLLAADDAVRFADAELRAVGEQLDQVRVRAASGLATDADVKDALAQFELASANQTEAQNAQANAIARLEALTGRSYAQLKRLPTTLILVPPQPQDERVWTARAEQVSVAVLLQKATLQIADLDHEKARKMSWPKVDLVGAAFVLDSTGGISGERDEDQERIGVMMSLPLYTGGQISATKRQSVAMQERAQALYDSAIVSAVRDTRIAYRNSASGLKRVEALQRAVDATIAAEDAMRAGFDAGTRTTADVLAAVERRYAAERDYAAARYKFLVNSLRLKQVSGNLLVADLAQINRLLQAR
jgi:outer membrane protein